MNNPTRAQLVAPHDGTLHALHSWTEACVLDRICRRLVRRHGVRAFNHAPDEPYPTCFFKAIRWKDHDDTGFPLAKMRDSDDRWVVLVDGELRAILGHTLQDSELVLDDLDRELRESA